MQIHIEIISHRVAMSYIHMIRVFDIYHPTNILQLYVTDISHRLFWPPSRSGKGRLLQHRYVRVVRPTRANINHDDDVCVVLSSTYSFCTQWYTWNVFIRHDDRNSVRHAGFFFLGGRGRNATHACGKSFRRRPPEKTIRLVLSARIHNTYSTRV